MRKILQLDQIVGHEREISVLKNNAIDNRLSSAYIFSGDNGIGKMTVAIGFSLFLLYKNDNRAILERLDPIQHPDLHIVSPERKSGKVKSEIGIDDIKDLICQLSFKPYRSEYKLAIIEDGDRMNSIAANGFLKTLEEPPGNTVIIITTSRLTSLLPTIISRSQIIRFGKHNNDHLARIISQELSISYDEAVKKVSLSSGSLDELLDGKDEVDQLAEKIGFNLLLKGGNIRYLDIYKSSDMIDRYPNNNLVDKILDVAQKLLRDMIALKSCKDNYFLFYKEFSDSTRKVATAVGVDKMIDIFDFIDRLKMAREVNINPFIVYTLLASKIKLHIYDE